MGPLGESLRKEREARGISLEEISQHTNISVRLLKTIEDEQFDRLPGGIFNKSFVRQYARYVGLDEEMAVQEYLRALSASRETPSAPKTPLPEMNEPALGVGYPRLILTAVCLGALVAGILYGVYRFRERLPEANRTIASASTETNPAPSSAGTSSSGIQEPGAATSQIASEPLPNNPAVADSGTTGAFQTSASSTAASAPGERVAADRPAGPGTPTATPREGLQLEIAARGTVWLSISADSEKQWQGTMRANETRQVKAQESVRLTIGDAGAVELTLNGKPLPPVGKAGEVKTLTITASGLPKPPS